MFALMHESLKIRELNYMGRTFRDNCFKILKEEAYYHTQTRNMFSVTSLPTAVVSFL